MTFWNLEINQLVRNISLNECKLVFKNFLRHFGQKNVITCHQTAAKDY